jgi:hypothetical protein
MVSRSPLYPYRVAPSSSLQGPLAGLARDYPELTLCWTKDLDLPSEFQNNLPGYGGTSETK